jgi:exonuclease-1
MGIKGLLMNTKSMGRTRNIKEYEGKTVGIDGYSWLHKALHSASKNLLAHGNYLEKFVTYFERNIRHFQSHRIKVVVVFDGDKLPVKLKTENERYLGRKKNYDLAMENYKAGNKTLANFQYFQSIDVSPAMAFYVKKRLEEIFASGLEFIVAPYEADSQLAYLSRIGYVDIVITEDSDLLAFGAQVILYKMGRSFDGVEYRLKDFQTRCEEFDFSGWNHDRFIQFCILCGCDYLENPAGIGIKRAFKLVEKHGSFRNFYPYIKGKVNEEYQIKFLSAFLCFKYPTVYCSVKRRAVNLMPIDSHRALIPEFDRNALVVAEDFHGGLSFLGKVDPDSVVFQVANMMIDPITKESFISGYENLYNTKKGPKGKSTQKKVCRQVPVSRSVSLVFQSSPNFSSNSISNVKIDDSPFDCDLDQILKSSNACNILTDNIATKHKLKPEKIPKKPILDCSESILILNDNLTTKPRISNKATTLKKATELILVSEHTFIDRSYHDNCEILHGERKAPSKGACPRLIRLDVSPEKPTLKKVATYSRTNNNNSDVLEKFRIHSRMNTEFEKDSDPEPQQKEEESRARLLNAYRVNPRESSGRQPGHLKEASSPEDKLGMTKHKTKNSTTTILGGLSAGVYSLFKNLF